VKINLINHPSSFLHIQYLSLLLKLSQIIVIKYNSNFLLIFMQDSGNNPALPESKMEKDLSN